MRYAARVRFSLLPRDVVLLSFRCYAARVRFSLLPRNVFVLLFKFSSARVRLSLLPRDRVVLLFSYCAARVRLFSPTPCHSERSRGISWKRTRRLGNRYSERGKKSAPHSFKYKKTPIDLISKQIGEYKKMEQVMRIELTTTAWEAVVLPLNYTCNFFAYYIKKRRLSQEKPRRFLYF